MRDVWLLVLLGCNSAPLAIPAAAPRAPTCRDALRCVEEECGSQDLACLVYHCAAQIGDVEALHLYALIGCWKGSCTSTPDRWNEAFEGTAYVNAEAACVVDSAARCAKESAECGQ